LVETIQFVWRNLPHWLVAERPYFITLRLGGTLPRQVVNELAEERRQMLEDKVRRADGNKHEELQRRQFARIEAILDGTCHDRHWLSDVNVAGIVMDGMGWLETECGWRIYAATIMSNHVHIVLRNTEARNGELQNDLARYKSFTGRMANKALGRSGSFWARECFDHWCRNEAKVSGAVRYVLDNPVKAGLVEHWSEWPWTRVDEAFV